MLDYWLVICGEGVQNRDRKGKGLLRTSEESVDSGMTNGKKGMQGKKQKKCGPCEVT